MIAGRSLARLESRSRKGLVESTQGGRTSIPFAGLLSPVILKLQIGTNVLSVTILAHRHRTGMRLEVLVLEPSGRVRSGLLELMHSAAFGAS